MANLTEGGRRLEAAGLVALKVSAGAGALVLVIIAFFWLTHSLRLLLLSSPLPTLGAVTFWLAVLGSVLCVAGWVLRGFGGSDTKVRQ